MKLNPYDLLGVSPDAQWKDIKKAYKNMLVKTHPDKMGNAKYFMLVHEAYEAIKKVQKHTYSRMPHTKTAYKADIDDDAVQPRQMKNFTPERFNRHFVKHRIDQHDPYAHNGYGNSMCKSKSYQEDDSQIQQARVNIPTHNIVVYQEPECLPSSSSLQSCYHFGADINDFSGGGGTDILKAYGHRNGTNIDTVRRYSSVDELVNSRSSESLKMSKEEIIRAQKLERTRTKLEQMRVDNVTNQDSIINERYTQLHRRLQ